MIGAIAGDVIGTVHESDFEDAVRNAISLGGDADTLACIAGAVAGPYFGVPAEIEAETLAQLDDRLRDVLTRFRQRFQ